MKFRVVIGFLLITTFFYGNSQNLESFQGYKNWGISVNPIVFRKASITRDGNTDLNNRTIVSAQLGIKYNFFNNKSFSVNTGLKFTLQPQMNSNFELSQEDVYASFGGFKEYIKEYSSVYISVPLNIEYRKSITNKLIFNSSLGLEISYITNSRDDISIQLSSSELDETREVFAAYYETQDKQLQGALSISGGFYIQFSGLMSQLNLIYSKSFTNLLEGEYQFGNLLVSDPTRGDYNLSGDYFGLSTTIYLKK